MADGKNILIEVNNLKKYFPVKTGFMKMNYVKAVDDVSSVSYTHLPSRW